MFLQTGQTVQLQHAMADDFFFILNLLALFLRLVPLPVFM